MKRWLVDAFEGYIDWQLTPINMWYGTALPVAIAAWFGGRVSVDSVPLSVGVALAVFVAGNLTMAVAWKLTRGEDK
jgi:hypothetical protein